MTIPLRLLATGKAVPPHVLSADDIDARLGLPPGTTLHKSGVRLRHVAAEGDTQSALGAAALHDALARAGLQVQDIDLLISACGVPEQALPSTACFVAEAAGLPRGTPAFDVNASCLGFLAAMRVAGGLLASGGYRRIAIVSSDLASRGLDWSEPEASMIFGDGAAAVILQAADITGAANDVGKRAADEGRRTPGIAAWRMETYPEGKRFCEIRAGGTRRNPRNGAVPQDFLFHMDGRAVFKLAAKVMPAFLDALLADAGCDAGAIDLVVPHQASHLGMAHAARKLGLAASRIVDIYATHGNQVAASLPTALHEALVTGRARAGDRLLLIGTAAGLNVGGLVLDL